ANQQPWTFVVVSDIAVKRQIREASEKVEKDFYSKESTKKWTDALKHLGTVPSKPFLETAPYLIVIFSQRYGFSANGDKIKHYYVSESIGIATGMLITALHRAGLATLTYTPANMKFLNKILSRPPNEKPFMILVTGFPSKNALVPAIQKKALSDVSVFI
ncbi:MAG: nitroreductase family protein, partial [bacterium]|nr:nitroreductase family protein [bacterium]